MRYNWIYNGLYFNRKSRGAVMYFQELELRLIARVKAEVRDGRLSERRLARLAGVSQPHVHHVLSGARNLSTELADRLLRRLRMSVLDLAAEPPAPAAWREVPLLDGRLGPAFPIPERESRLGRYPFPAALVAGLESPAAARLGEDNRTTRWFREGDLVLLDRSPAVRSRPCAGVWHAVSMDGRGALRRVRVTGQGLYLSGDGAPEFLSLAGKNILDILKARAVWVGREIAPLSGLDWPGEGAPPFASRPTEEAGRQD